MQRVHWQGVFTSICCTLNSTPDPWLSRQRISKASMLHNFFLLFSRVGGNCFSRATLYFFRVNRLHNTATPTSESPLIGETTRSPLISSTIDASTQSSLMFRTRDFGHTEQNGTNDQLPSGLSIHIPRCPLLIIQVSFPSPVDLPS